MTKVKFKNTVNVRKAKKMVNVKGDLAVGLGIAMEEEEAVVADVAAMRLEDLKIALILVTRGTQNVVMGDKVMVAMADSRTEEGEIAEVAVAAKVGKTLETKKKPKMTGSQDRTPEEVEDVGTVVAMDNSVVAVEDSVVIEAEEIAEVAVVETKASEVVVEEAIAVVVAIKETVRQTMAGNADTAAVVEVAEEVVKEDADVDVVVNRVKLREEAKTSAGTTTAIETINGFIIRNLRCSSLVVQQDFNMLSD